MFLDKKYYFELEEFTKVGVKALYTTTESGDFQDLEVRKKFLERVGLDEKNIYTGHQTHSANIKIIDENTENYIENNDGFITNLERAVIFTRYADCLPIYFYEESKKVFACVHSGWQGSFQKIGIKCLEMIVENYQVNLENIKIAFGIGISKECYEVGEEFYKKFQEKFSKNILEKSFEFKDGKIYFDNQKFNLNLFLEMGIKKENIIENNLCTYKEIRFHSYRRDKENSGRNGAYIFIDKTSIK